MQVPPEIVIKGFETTPAIDKLIDRGIAGLQKVCDYIIRIREELALIRRTFDSARRELEEVVERQRGEVKTPAYRSLLAVVEKIFREQGYGFLRTLEGEQVYFHKNSVLHGHWQKLRVGTAVRYAAELGEKGLQASTLEPVGRPGVAESHNQLHELPASVLPPSAKRR